MEEIEERINAIANSLVESIAYKPNEYDLGIAKDALTMIATEQKQIDIDKAKEAFNKTCGWLAIYPWYNGVFEEFVKVIKE